MTLHRATLAVLCIACLVAASGVLRATGWPGNGAGHTLVFQELRAGSLILAGRDIAPGPGAVPAPDFAAMGAAHAGAPAAATEPTPGPGLWGDYQGYLADPDGHVWSGMQR